MSATKHGEGVTILVSGGAGYIGSHVVHGLKASGFRTVVIDNLVNGHAWAARKADHFHQCDIGDADRIAALCREYRPAAALHFAAFIEVGESVQQPEKYFTNNRDKAGIFFSTLAANGVDKLVFSSTAAVYGEVTTSRPVREDDPTLPINPYGQSKLDAELALRRLPVRSVALRYFNVAGAAEPGAGIGEAHFPETHLIPRIVLPLIDAPKDICDALGLAKGFRIFGDDYATPDGTAVRDYVHVADLAAAHLRALVYLLQGGANEIINLGSSRGYSVREIVQAAARVLNRPDFDPPVMPRREGDPPFLVASNAKAKAVLGWQPQRGVEDMILSAAAWHAGTGYLEAMRARIASQAG